MSPSAPHTTLRRIAAAAALAAAFAVPAAAQAADAPSVDVEVGARTIQVAGAEDLGRGPVRLSISGDTLDGARTVAVVALKPGVTLDDIEEADLDDVTARPASATAYASEHLVSKLERFGRLVAGGQVSAATGHTATIVAAPGDYAILDVTAENAGVAGFAVGDEHNGASIPKSDVTIGLRDKGLFLPSLLPADGIFRISNQGDRLHQATAYRLKRSASYREAVRAAYRGRFLGRFGTPTVLTGVISGHLATRVEVSLRPGRYLVVSEYTPFTLNGRSDVSRGLVGTTRVR